MNPNTFLIAIVLISAHVLHMSKALETRTIFTYGLKEAFAGPKLENILVGEFSMISPADLPSASAPAPSILKLWKVGGNIRSYIFQDSYFYYDYASDSINQFMISTAITKPFITALNCTDFVALSYTCDAILEFSIVYNTTRDKAILFFTSSRASLVGTNTTKALLSVPMQSIPSNGLSLAQLYNLPTLSFIANYSRTDNIEDVVPNTKVINGNRTTFAFILPTGGLGNSYTTITNFKVQWVEPVAAITYPSNGFTGFFMQSISSFQIIVSKFATRIGAIFWVTPVSNTQWQICVFNPQSSSSVRNTSSFINIAESATLYSQSFSLMGETFGAMQGTIVAGFYEDSIYPNVFYIYTLGKYRNLLFQITLNHTSFSGVYSPSTINTLPMEYKNTTVPIQRVDIVADYSRSLLYTYYSIFRGDICISTQRITTNGVPLPSPPQSSDTGDSLGNSCNGPSQALLFYVVLMFHVFVNLLY